MVTSFLKTCARITGVFAISASMGCSLVVDTDECVSDADCNFGDGAQLQCVSKECVPRPATARQALVESTVERDTSWTAQTTWLLPDVVVVESGVTLTVEAGASIVAAPDAVLVLEPGAQLVLDEPRPDLELIVIDENAGEVH